MKMQLPDGVSPEDMVRMIESVSNQPIPAKLRDFILKHGAKSKITKTYSMRPKWQPLLDEMIVAKDEAERADAKLEAKKNLFWRTVEADLKQYKFGMQWNEKTKEIEQLDEIKEIEL